MSGENLYRAKLFLETLRQSGVEEIFLTPNLSKKSPQTAPPSGRKEVLLELREKVIRCTKCDELARTRHSVVFGSGHPESKLMFVGEAPGFDEDQQGLPFVGRAGQLLTKMIEAIQLRREEVFIANVLKCRPPGNRSPKPQEIQNCEPYLVQQIAILQPKVICALGTFAAQTLLKTVTPISALRGKIHHYQGIPVICTFHPAYLLRNPAEKRKSWEDLKKLKTMLEEDAAI